MEKDKKNLALERGLEIANKYNKFIQELNEAHKTMSELKLLLTEETLELFTQKELNDVFNFMTYACVHINDLSIAHEVGQIAEMIEVNNTEKFENNLTMN